MSFTIPHRQTYLVLTFIAVTTLGVFFAGSANAFIPSDRSIPFETRAETTPVFGQPSISKGSASGSDALSFNFGSAADIELSNGYLYVADSTNDRIFIFESESDTTPDEVIGDSDLNGAAVFSGRGNSAGDTMLQKPIDLEVWSSSSKDTTALFVADSNNNRVVVFVDTATSGIPFTSNDTVNPQGIGGDLVADHVFGQCSFSSGSNDGCGGSVSDTGFKTTTGVFYQTTSGADTLWVSDAGNSRVLGFRFDRSDLGGTFGTPTGLPNDGTKSDSVADFAFGASTTSAGGSKVGNASDTFGAPNSLTIANGRIYIVDAGSKTSRVVVDTAWRGTSDTQFAAAYGQPDVTSIGTGSDSVSLNEPEDVEVTSSGQVAISDSLNDRVLFYDNPLPVDGSPVPVAVIGDTDLDATSTNADNASVSDSSVNGPDGITFGSSILIAEYVNNRVTKWENEGAGGSSDDGTCLIQRAGTPNYVLKPLRRLRDRMLNTAVGRWLTDAYYSFSSVISA